MMSDRPQMRVLVVSASQKITELFNELLPPAVFNPIISASSCGEAKRAQLAAEYDIVVINTPLSDEFGTEFALDLAADSAVAVLLLVSAELHGEVAGRVESYGVMTLSKPLNRSTLSTAMSLAYATRARLRVMDVKLQSLSARMGELRVINRAKWTLIEALGMTEVQAHRYIEKQAMDQRVGKGEIAIGILKTYGK